LLAAYADGLMIDRDATGEAYLSHFVFGPEMQSHYARNRNSVAAYSGPCWCRWLVLDIDRPDPADALADARKVVAFLRERYDVDDVPVYFSGSKGFHVLMELAHNPPPAVGFHRVVKTLALSIAGAVGVKIDPSIYDVNHIIRLPNTWHPKTGLFKRRIDADDLFRLDIDRIREHSRHPAGDGIPTVATCPPHLADDWRDATREAVRVAESRAVVRRDAGPDARAPRYFLDLLRFGVPEGERHVTLFRSAAWLTEQGAPPSLCVALLTEPGRDIGLTPADVDRQIACGIEHARRQRGPAVDSRPDLVADPDAFESWAIQHEADPLPVGALDFPFGGLAPRESEGGPPA
jgi:hypothetical protein